MELIRASSKESEKLIMKKKICGCFYERNEKNKKENNIKVGSSHFNLISIIEQIIH